MQLTPRTFWFSLNQTGWVKLSDAITGSSLTLPKANTTRFLFAFFNGDIRRADKFAGDLSNVASCTLVLRRSNETGELLYTATKTSSEFHNAACTYPDWTAQRDWQVGFELSKLETNWPPLVDWDERIWVAVEIMLSDGSEVTVGHGILQLVDPGIDTTDPVTRNIEMKASQAEAEAGTDNSKWMTPLRTLQALAALGGASGNRSLFSFYDISTAGSHSLDVSHPDNQVLIALQAGAYTYRVQLTGSPLIGSKFRILFDFSPGTQTADVRLGSATLFSFTNTGSASVADVSFVWSGTEWKAASPNLVYVTSGGGGGSGGSTAIGIWMLDGANAAVSLLDSSGNGNSLSVSPGTIAPTLSTLGGQDAAFFEGNSMLQFTLPSALSSFSVAMRVGGTDSGIIAQAGSRDDIDAENGSFRLIVIGNLVVWQLFDGGDVNCSAVFPNDGSPHVLVGTFDGVSLKLYLDGALVQLLNHSPTWSPSALVTPFTIGGNISGGVASGLAQGLCNRVALYSSCLTENEIAAISA